jgi:hypothetical protein
VEYGMEMDQNHASKVCMEYCTSSVRNAWTVQNLVGLYPTVLIWTTFCLLVWHCLLKNKYCYSQVKIWQLVQQIQSVKISYSWTVRVK